MKHRNLRIPVLAFMIAAALVFVNPPAAALIGPGGGLGGGTSAGDGSGSGGIPGGQVYYDPFISSSVYTVTRPGTPFSGVEKMDSSWLLQMGNPIWHEGRSFALHWDEAAYNAGLASGADRFVITGRYGPELLSAEDKLLWDSGKLSVTAESIPSMEIQVLRDQSYSFSIRLVEWWDWYEDGGGVGYYPLYDCPTPFGAESVLFEQSHDGITWYGWEETGVFGHFDSPLSTLRGDLFDDNGEAIRFYPDETCYFRMTITGSAYDGIVSTVVLNAPKEPDKNDDTGGNRGGGGQEEGSRDLPGAAAPEEPEPTTGTAGPKQPQKDIRPSGQATAGTAASQPDPESSEANSEPEQNSSVPATTAKPVDAPAEPEAESPFSRGVLVTAIATAVITGVVLTIWYIRKKRNP